MRKDPIVAEVRAARERLAAACGFDIHKIIKQAQQAQAVSGRRVVSFEQRPPNDTSSRNSGQSGPVRS